MFCRKCGKKLLPDSSFCDNCGQWLYSPFRDAREARRYRFIAAAVAHVEETPASLSKHPLYKLGKVFSSWPRWVRVMVWVTIALIILAVYVAIFGSRS